MGRDMARPPLLQALCLAGLSAQLWLAGAADDEAPAFLGSELPLRMLSVLPSSRRGAKDSTTQIGGRTAITVVFSRAVIALGADWSDKGNDGKLAPELLPFSMQACEGQPEFAVPGKIRWTTTAIARFDPDVDWPNDLCFRLVPNLALRTFDGLALDGESLAAAGRWQFKTSPVRMYMSHVRSKEAAALTGGRWTADLFERNSGRSGTSHECPPDASVYLRFSSDIDHEMTYKALQGANPQLLSSSQTPEVCGKRCIAVKPRGLEPGQRYNLVFPQGARYRRIAGLASRESSVGLAGLVPFTFPFWFEKPPANKYENTKLHARRLLLYLRHGLESQSGEEAQLQKLKASIALNTQGGQPMDFELRRLDNATLQLQAFQLMPASTYKLEVKSNSEVRDGFGQPLSACRMEFQTGDWPDQFLQAEDSPAYFRTSPGPWTVLARGDGNTWCQRPGSRTTPVVIPMPEPLASNMATAEAGPAPVAMGVSSSASSPSSGPITERRLSCQDQPFEMRGWPVSSADLPTALAQRYHEQQTFLPVTSMVKVVAPLKKELEVLTLDENKLLLGANHSGLFLRELQRSSQSSTKGFVSVASFGAAFVATAAGELIVWAMSYSGEPVVGATVKVFRIEKTYQTQLMDITSVISGTTGADGMVTVKPSGSMSWGEGYPTLVALVEAEGSVAYSEAVPVPSHQEQEASTRAELVTDRSIYRPGDTVHVKGYVRTLKADGTGYTLPWEGEASYSIEVVWNRQTPNGRPSKPVKVSTPIVARYGTLSAELKVPSSDEEVTYGPTKISLMRTPIPMTGSGPASWALAFITIADPRPPTVKLNMSSPDKVVLPGAAASVDLAVFAATYTGTPVEGAKVEVSWHLRRGSGFEGGQDESPREVKGLVGLSPSAPTDFLFNPMGVATSEDDEASGKLTVVTGMDGKGTAILSLAALLEEVGENGMSRKPAAEGDELSLSARWVGPTREVVTAELEDGSLPVARSRYVLGITPNRPVDTDIGTPLPGTAFAVFVDLRNEDGDSLEGTEVALSMYEWNGAAPVHEDPMAELTTSTPRDVLQQAAMRSGLLPVESWGVQVGDTCRVSADGGKEAKCKSILTLPAAKQYVVLAKATDPDGVELVTAFPVGRTPEMWKKRPLQSLDAAVSIHKDKSTHAVGETVELSLVSPFEDPTVLVVWGNGEGRKTKQQKLAGAPGRTHTLQLPLGSECTFGCNAVVLLSAPDQPRGAMLPIEVPVSPLLDVTLPRMVVNTVQIKVPDTQRTFGKAPLNIYAADANGDPLDVFQPGDSAQITVAVPESARGAEVCIFVVDKAMLDVGGSANPHPVTKLDERFELSRGDDFHVEDTVSALASSEGYRTTVNVTLHRAKLDPFPVDFGNWPLRPSGNTPSPVEMTDADYFAAHTDDATHFPPGQSHFFTNGDLINGPVMAGAAMPMAMASESLEMARAAPMMMKSARGGAGLEVEEDEVAADMPPAPASPESLLATRAKHGHSKGTGTALGKEAFTRSQFETTPLFKASIVVGADGKVSVPFKLPDNIATFEVRAYFVDGNGEHKFGHAQTTFISRRDVSLMPSVPRVVRPGDRFECGVTVTSHHKASLVGGFPDAVSIWASVKGENATVGLRMSEASEFEASLVEGEERITFTRLLKPSHMGGSPEEVVFPFKAPMPLEGGSLGTSTLRFSAHVPSSSDEKAGTQVDGLEANLTVKAQQAPVHIATSLAIIASTTRKAEAAEGIQLPAAMPGSGKLGVTVGVGHLPAVLENSANLLSRHMDNGQVLVASLAPAAALSAYFDGLSEKPPQGLEDAGEAFRSAVARLPAFTPRPDLGLIWTPDEFSPGRGPPRASVYLNGFALLVARLVKLFHQPTAGNPVAPSLGGWTPESLRGLSHSWKKALEQELRKQVLDTHFHVVPRCNSNCYRNWMEFAFSRAALGYAWTSYDAVVQQELDMSRLFSKEALDSMGTIGLAHAALAYTLHCEPTALPPEAPARLSDIYNRLASQMRVQGRTAYVAASVESPHSAGLEANAAVLLAMSRASPQELAQHFADNAGASLVAKLAAYVADGAGAGHSVRFGGGEWMGTREAALAIFGLASHDRAHGSTKPDLSLEAVSGSVDVLKYEAKGAGAAPASVSLAWEQLPIPPKPLRFQVGGRGQVSVAAALTFVPASAPTAGAIYRGLYVEKVVRRMDGATGEATGPPLDLVRLGESVVVTIQVTSPDDLERVTLQDFAAGGLEPVDPKVAGDSTGSSASGGCGGPFAWSWWCWPAFAGRQTYADRVKWTSGGRLPAGTHTVSYQAIAATRGVFSLPPAHAYAEDQPELMGLSQAGTIVVVGSGCSGSFAGFSSDEVTPDVILQKLKVQPARRLSPKGCSGGCPNGGVCQLSTGKCGCYHGLSFVDGDCPAPARSGSDKDAIRLVLQGGGHTGGSTGIAGSGPVQTAAYATCGVLLVVIGGLGVLLAQKPRWLSRGGDNARFIPCRDEPYTSMELMERP